MGGGDITLEQSERIKFPKKENNRNRAVGGSSNIKKGKIALKQSKWVPKKQSERVKKKGGGEIALEQSVASLREDRTDTTARLLYQRSSRVGLRGKKGVLVQ